MRMVFFGSPEGVIAPLSDLVQHGPAGGWQVVGVVSQPARPLGRKHTPQDPPVAAYAKTHGLHVLQPEKASDPGFLASFAALAPDVAVTAAYGQILSDAFLQIPKRATINIHPSLLPKYRGATPVNAALLAGENTTGVSVLFTVKQLDAGNIISQQPVVIDPDVTADVLTANLFKLSSGLLFEALAKLKDRSFVGTPQDPEAVSYCKKINKDDGNLPWDAGAENLYNRFRAYYPWPGSFSFFAGRRIGFTKMRRLGTPPMPRLAAGEFYLDKPGRVLVVGCGQGVVGVEMVKPAGSKEMDAAAFWNGIQEKVDLRFSAYEQ